MQVPFCENTDDSMRMFLLDGCELLGHRESDYQEYSPFEFLQVVARELGDSISLDRIAMPRILDRKLETLRDTQAFQLCRELRNNDTSLLRGEQTLISFIKSYLADLCKPPRLSLDLTDKEREVQLIKKRRANGSL